MSRRFPRILVLPSLLALTAILACGGDDNPADPDPVTTSVAVTPSSSTLVAGDSVTLSAQARNSDGAVVSGATFTWSSSDATVAEVSPQGVVRALRSGVATVTATFDGIAGTASLTIQIDPVLAAFAPLVGDTVTLVPQASLGQTDISRIQGAVLDLDEATATVGLTLIDANRQALGPRIALQADPGSVVGGDGRLTATDASVLGLNGVRVWAWIAIPPVGDSPLQLILDARPGAGPLPAAAPSRGASRGGSRGGPLRSGAEDREGFLQYWEDLGNQGGMTTLDRWSRVVQRIIDVNLEQQDSKGDFIDAVTDDLVDVFVNDADYRYWLIDGTSTLSTGQHIADPGDLSGFTPIFQNGEGRFRHFSANAALNEEPLIPEFVVNLLGRIAGGDFNPENDPTGDIAADLATNELGRQFPGELGRLWDRKDAGESDERIDDGESVRKWLLGKFGPPPSAVTIVPNPIPTLTPGSSTQLGSSVTDADGNVLTGWDVTWTSSDPNVLTIDANGMMTRTGPGKATVTAQVEGTGPQTSTVVDVTGLEITGPASIDFSHTMGVTPCPQFVATYTIRNVLQVPVTFSAVEQGYGGPLRMDGTPVSGTLQPGESTQVTITYICSTDRSFTSAFEFNGTTGPQGEQFTTLIPVNGTIDATPGSITVTTTTTGDNAPESFIVRDVETDEVIGTIGPNETKTFTDRRPGRYPVLLVRPDGSTCQETTGSFLKDIVVPAGGTGMLDFQISCSGSPVERRLELDYGAIQNSSGSVAPGTQTIPLLENGSAVGSIPLIFTGSTFVDPSRGVVGLGQNASIELDLENAELPSGAPAPDQLKIEIQGRDNGAPQDLRIQRKQSDGSVVEETTTQIQNGSSIIDGESSVLLQALSVGFFDFVASIFFGG